MFRLQRYGDAVQQRDGAAQPRATRIEVLLGTLVMALILVVGVPRALYAQAPSDHCISRRGHSATVIVSASADIRINGSAPGIGDILTVVTGDGLCAGMMEWTGKDTAFAIWGDDYVTGGGNGLALNEPLSFTLWDVSNSLTYDASNSKVQAIFGSDRPYLKADGKYAPDAIYLLHGLSFRSLEDLKQARFESDGAPGH